MLLGIRRVPRVCRRPGVDGRHVNTRAWGQNARQRCSREVFGKLDLHRVRAAYGQFTGCAPTDALRDVDAEVAFVVSCTWSQLPVPP